MTKTNDEIRDAIEAFLKNWDRAEFQNDHGTLASEVDATIQPEGDYIMPGTVDPDGVEGDATALDVSHSWAGWDCREGWRAHRAGARLILNWWRAPNHGRTARHARDLWVVVDPKFFASKAVEFDLSVKSHQSDSGHEDIHGRRSYSRAVRVEADGSVLAWDTVGESYSRHHDLAEADVARALDIAGHLLAR